MAQEVANVTLGQARAEAELIRRAAEEDAAKLRAEAQQFETDVAAMEREIAALAKQLSVLETEATHASPGQPRPSIPALPRIRWGADEADGAGAANGHRRDKGNVVIGGSSGGHLTSLASATMVGTLAPEMAEVVAERTRLEREIAATKRRIERSESGASPRAEAERELGALVLTAYNELAVMEREHGLAIESCRSDARDEAARILEAAREQAAALHARATELADSSGLDLEPDRSVE
jgi:hypothetical protein